MDIRHGLPGFYSKETDYNGILIKAPAIVSDDALVEAKRRLHMMLRNLPNVVENLRNDDSELHIIAKDQVTSDLPEYAHLKGKPFDGKLTVDERTRGLGGLLCSCGEENLLRLKKDRYRGRDICVHEFAHTTMNFGFDDALRKKIKEQYEKTIAKKLWNSTYAATNVDEFFAELSMWYFGTRGDYGELEPEPKPGREWFQAYDPESCALIDDIYSGRIAVKKNDVRVQLTALSPDQERSLKSQNSEQPTTVSFLNRSPYTVQLWWIDFNGNRKSYGQILPGDRVLQQTYVTHPFILTDEKGRGLAIVMPKKEPGIYRLEK